MNSFGRPTAKYSPIQYGNKQIAGSYHEKNDSEEMNPSYNDAMRMN